MKRVKKLIVMVLAIAMIAGSLSFNVNAASKLKKPTITKVTKKISTVASGVIYTVKWKKVKGAKGYQVRESAKEAGEWFTSTKFTSKCTYKTGGSTIDTFKIKVRAYKIVNGRKKYGAWSKVKTIKVF